MNAKRRDRLACVRRFFVLFGVVSLVGVLFLSVGVAFVAAQDGDTGPTDSVEGTDETYVYHVPFTRNTQKLPSSLKSKITVRTLNEEASIQVDYNADGVFEESITLAPGEGKSFEEPAEGSVVQSTKPINVKYRYASADFGAYEDDNQKYGVPEQDFLGTEYYLPVNADDIWVAASTSTTIEVDTDGDGSYEQTESVPSNGATKISQVESGTHVTADDPVHVVAERSRWSNMDYTYLVSLLPVENTPSSYEIPSEPSYSRNSPTSKTGVYLAGTQMSTSVEVDIGDDGSTDRQLTLGEGEVSKVETTEASTVTADAPITAVYTYHVAAGDPWESTRREYIGALTPVKETNFNQGSWSGTSEDVEAWSTYEDSRLYTLDGQSSAENSDTGESGTGSTDQSGTGETESDPNQAGSPGVDSTGDTESGGGGLGGVATMFREPSENASTWGAILSVGILGVGYLTYRRRNTDEEDEAIAKECPECRSRVGPSKTFCGNCGAQIGGDGETNSVYKKGTKQSSETEQTVRVSEYGDLSVGRVVETGSGYQLSEANVAGTSESVCVVTPSTKGGQTLDVSRTEDFLDDIGPWAKMDSHPNLLEVYGHGEEPLPWLAVEPAKYPSVREVADDLSESQKLKVLSQICEAVHHVHRYGIVYENLSPESVKIADSTQVKLVGSLDFLSGESDTKVTERTVVYRIGNIAKYLLTSSEEGGTPDEVWAEIDTSLSENPSDRHDTVLHFRDDLRQAYGQNRR